MKNEMSMYRIFGESADGQVYDEYCEASTAQVAVDRAREWHDYDRPGYKVIEVAKVLKSGWK